MLNTSQLYKDLFSQGAIEEYKIVVDDTEYLQDSIYDTIWVKQQLFSTDTFNVGGFALSTLEVKLKVPTISIPRNAFIKFYYRLTNGDENSEWIPKFSGRVVKRRRFTDDVTTIEALSKGANYDVFLDVFPDATDIYPADNREIANLCATHLGLPIENINEIYDGNNVEYPNEETVISVLQYIAALSGGNWIITEDDNLRLVVLNKTITDIPKYSAFNIVSEEEKPPISKVTMYYRDSKAFTSGDDTGSELIIDCPWATQETTDYVLSLYQGYVYKPMQGVGVSIDGALQLGDSFEYDNNEIQLATKIDYEFAGALVANVDAPTNVEDGYDDPWSDLVKAPLRRKVTLGDSYQGVTISREFGIETLLSPTGKEEDAIAKYYADLNKGMAFQYRDSSTDEWEDWLYFDTNEKRFKLMLKSGKGDIEDVILLIEADVNGIRQEIIGIHQGNIIPNFNGMMGLTGWSGTGETLYIPNMDYVEDITYGTVAYPKFIEGSLSEWGLSFYNSGEMLSPFGLIIPDSDYSFKGKIGNFKAFTIKVYEYKNMGGEPFKTTTFNFDSSKVYNEFTITPQTETRYIKLGINVPTATIDSQVTFTEMMFNRGEPKAYYESVQDAIAYSKSILELTSEKISLSNEKIDKISGDIHNTMVDIDGFDGLVIKNSNGKGLTVLNNQGEKVIELNANGDVISRNMIAENIFATGVINAIRGEIGNFEIENGVLTFTSPVYSREYTRSDLSAIRNIIMTDKIPTNYEKYIYDVNNDGSVNSLDYTIIRNYLDRTRPKPKDPQIQSMVQLGNNDGQIKSTTLYDNGKIGVETLIQADTIKTGNIDTQGLSIDGKSVEVDSNGFLKLV